MSRMVATSSFPGNTVCFIVLFLVSQAVSAQITLPVGVPRVEPSVDWVDVQGPHIGQETYALAWSMLTFPDPGCQSQALNALSDQISAGSTNANDPNLENLLELVAASGLNSTAMNGPPTALITTRITSMKILAKLGGVRSKAILWKVIVKESDPSVLEAAWRTFALIDDGIKPAAFDETLSRQLTDPFSLAPHDSLMLALLMVIVQHHQTWRDMAVPALVGPILQLSQDHLYLSIVRQKAIQTLNTLMGF